MNPLADLLHARIRQAGPLSFADWMRAALYDPEHGYYTAGRARIGREGDFITSVSVGPLFGRLLAWQLAEMWERLERPAHFTVVEQGAHDGTLATDILQALAADWPECWAATEYVFIEPAAGWRARQEQTVAAQAERCRWVESADELRGLEGVALSNELLDAFPVHRLRWTADGWRELQVGLEGERFVWREGPAPTGALLEVAERIPHPLPAAYETEVCLETAQWLEQTARAFSRGWVLVIDYGYEREQLYQPERAQGTLSGYARQQRVDDLLADPGECDLTAHVDFTTLLEAAAQEGMELAGLTDQHRFLTALGARLFASGTTPPSPKELRAFRTLMHPELLGAAFKVLCLAKAAPTSPLAGFPGRLLPA